MKKTLGLKEAFHYELASRFQVKAEEANPVQLHAALSRAVMGLTLPAFESSMKNPARRAYYLSAEFLIGRSVFNNLYNLGLYEEAQGLLAQAGHDLKELEEIEDAALGNGGLGRLAACYLESAATLNLPLDGYGIRYKYGLFKQSFEDGFQAEAPDDWQKCLDPWSVRKEEDAVKLRMHGKEMLAVPYDMPTFGYRSRRVGRLRLWQCEAIEPFDFAGGSVRGHRGGHGPGLGHPAGLRSQELAFRGERGPAALLADAAHRPHQLRGFPLPELFHLRGKPVFHRSGPAGGPGAADPGGSAKRSAAPGGAVRGLCLAVWNPL